MRSVAIALLCVFLVACVLYYVPYKARIDVRYLAYVAQELGENQPPSLNGGYTFSSFSDGSKAVLYIATIPFRWAFYLVKQLGVFFGLMFGNAIGVIA